MPACRPIFCRGAGTALGSVGGPFNNKTLAIETRNDIDVNMNVIDVI
jgi:hypothetical protein